MENMVTNTLFWKNKKVFITGHTGFKGGWLTLWLQLMGANVLGYALAPTTKDSFFAACKIDASMTSLIADIRDFDHLEKVITQFQPEIIFHLAAQPLVLQSYEDPIETYSTNVLGVVHVLEAARRTSSVRAIVNVTTDKCYENKEWTWSYREIDTLGGHDPYSNSKACSELVTQAYRDSFFNNNDVRLASARSGNVIGGGDWSKDRLVPDAIRAYIDKKELTLRYPMAIRPWQHVLEPVHGYLLLAEKIYLNSAYAESWNFGPDEKDINTVKWVINYINSLLDHPIRVKYEKMLKSHEATLLKLDCAKAKNKLGWYPRWDIKRGIEETIRWYEAYQRNPNMRDFSISQITDFMALEQRLVMEA